MASWFRRGDYPEPPPPQVVPLGMAPGYRIVEHDDPGEMDKAGREAGVSASDTWNGHRIASFVNRKDQTVHLLSAKTTDDDGLYDARKVHEFAHTWDLSHDDTGKGWNGSSDVWGRINMNLALQKMAQTDQTKAATDPAASAVQVAKNLSPPQDQPANDDKPTTTASTGGAE